MKNKVVMIKRGCPICGCDVVGNEELKYLCKNCQIYFDMKHLKGGLYDIKN